ncbi:MAG: hypothetical protein AAGB00_00140 [Planctomycetota bacterium]
MCVSAKTNSFLLLTPLLLVAGCAGDDPTVAIRDMAALPAASATGSTALRGEVDRIEQAGHTPLGLMPPLPDPGDNGAAIFSNAMGDALRKQMVTKLLALTPKERFEFDIVQLEKVRKAMQTGWSIRQQLDKADAAPAFAFQVAYDLGFFGKMRFLDDAAVACRLHALAAAPALANGEIETALDELELAMRWADRLAQVKRVEARLLAAQLRGMCLSIVESMAGAEAGRPGSLLPPRFTPQLADTERMYALVRRSLADWPDDAGPLIGDRAVVMHSYEAIRQGMFDRLVTVAERAQLQRLGRLDRMTRMPPAEIDADELAYLEAMAKLIAMAGRPHYERASAVQEALAPFEPGGANADRAPLAAQLFLPGLGYAVREMARDRAVCEGWAIALAAAGGLDLPPFKVNPATGVEYEVERTPDRLIVRLGDDEVRDPVVKPLP